MPRDVSEALLTQQSKGRHNTVRYALCLSLRFSDIYTNLQPLHIAVKLGHIRPVKLIVEFSKSSILMLDVDGQTTLHAAVKLCYAQITSILLAAADPKGLQMENSVGNTPFEIVSLSDFSSRIQRCQHTNTMSELTINGEVESFYRYPGDYIQKLQKELAKLQAILDVLLAEGRLKRQTKLAKELTKFASMMKERLSAAETAHTARLARIPKEEEASADPKDSYDLEKTSSIIFGALKGLTINRQLIHLIDVQNSVGADLEKVGKHPSDESQARLRRKGALEAEEQDEEELEKAQSMVWQHTSHLLYDDLI